MVFPSSFSSGMGSPSASIFGGISSQRNLANPDIRNLPGAGVQDPAQIKKRLPFGEARAQPQLKRYQDLLKQMSGMPAYHGLALGLMQKLNFVTTQEN